MAHAFDKPAHRALPPAIEHDLSGAPDRATVAVAVLQTRELDGDLVASFFRRDREAAPGRGQAELRHGAAVFAAAAGDAEAHWVAQPQFVVVALGDRGGDDDRRAVEHGEQLLPL